MTMKVQRAEFVGLEKLLEVFGLSARPYHGQ